MASAMHYSIDDCSRSAAGVAFFTVLAHLLLSGRPSAAPGVGASGLVIRVCVSVRRVLRIPEILVVTSTNWLEFILQIELPFVLFAPSVRIEGRNRETP